MTESEIKNIPEVQQEIQDVLAEYPLTDEQMQEAAGRIVNILIDALDAMQEGD